jgi:hypothetical protein
VTSVFETYYSLRCDTVKSYRSSLTFRRKIQPPSSRLKSKISKTPPTSKKKTRVENLVQILKCKAAQENPNRSKESSNQACNWTSSIHGSFCLLLTSYWLLPLSTEDRGRTLLNFYHSKIKNTNSEQDVISFNASISLFYYILYSNYYPLS